MQGNFLYGNSNESKFADNRRYIAGWRTEMRSMQGAWYSADISLNTYA